jgi:3-deoxy-D-manno-octulosonic-acid transferase
VKRAQTFPNINLRFLLSLYQLIWFFGLPLIIAYLYMRGRKDHTYFKHLSERFGFHRIRHEQHIWLHAVSLGEIRSAAPLIECLLQGSRPIVTTHFTPAGRREAERLFPAAVAEGRLTACYVPFDYSPALNRFFKAFHPAYGLVMEFEAWPGMIMSSRKIGLPLFLCNGQYTTHGLKRDQKRYFSRAKIVAGFAGVMVKSERQAERFRNLGVKHVAITGEMRFEQPIPQPQIKAARALRKRIPERRPIITLASIVEGEDASALALITNVQNHVARHKLPKPLFIYVPRAPERFALVTEMIAEKGFTFATRSTVLDDDLKPIHPDKIADLDILLGDSLGEMYFYLSLCDLAIVGGGFCPKGSHNICEPLSLGKPVIIGPNDYTIEFPAHEAIAAGVCLKMDFDEIAQLITQHPLQFCPPDAIEAFLACHSGGTAKTLVAIERFLGNIGE